MIDMEEFLNQQPALRNRPTKENTQEVLELIRSQERDGINSDLLNEEGFLRRASRAVEPLPSIGGVDLPQRKTRRHSEQLTDLERSPSRYRWRSHSDAESTSMRTIPSSELRFLEMVHLPPLDIAKSADILPQRPECPTPTHTPSGEEFIAEYLRDERPKKREAFEGWADITKEKP